MTAKIIINGTSITSQATSTGRRSSIAAIIDGEHVRLSARSPGVLRRRLVAQYGVLPVVAAALPVVLLARGGQRQS